MSETIFSTGVPTIDALFGKNGVRPTSWIGFVGEPGTMKTLTCIKMAGEWLLSGEGNCIVYVTTETNELAINSQFYDFGYDLTPCIESGQFKIVDLFSENSIGRKDSDMTLSRKVIEATRPMKNFGGKILCIIDSLAPIWQIMPSMARTMFSTISHQIRPIVDLCIVTLQLSIGTSRGFGFGAEHGIDIMIRTGSYYHDGERTWIHVSKCRGDSCNKGLFDYHVDDQGNLVVGDEIKIKGRFKDIYEAIESLRYANRIELEEERNNILRSIRDNLTTFLGIVKT